MRASSTNISVK